MIRKIASAYLKSMLFALWTGLVFIAGAGTMYLALLAELQRRGLV